MTCRGFLQALVFLCGAAMLAGCGVAMGPVVASPGDATGLGELKGTVHGGQQPIGNAHVYVFAVGTGGYGTASTSLLLPGPGAASDTSGDYYVTTDAGGNFTLSGDYVCLAGQQVYLYISGGDPGGGANPAIGLMAGLGQCPTTGTLALQTPFVIVNEVSTVVMAYALAGFATDATHIASSNTALAATGVANAMADAVNIYSFVAGQVLGQTANGAANVPVNQINTIANILAACVNSGAPGGLSGACGTLFNNSRARAGNEPADTASAAINIAQAPFNSVSPLFGLQVGTAPFQPGQAVVPPDFTVGLFYTTAAYQLNASGSGGFNEFDALAVDSGGNVWARGNGNAGAQFVKYGPTGAQLATAVIVGAGNAGADDLGSRIDIDSADNVWSAGVEGEFEVSSQGAVLSPPSGFYCPSMASLKSTVFGPNGIAYIGDAYDAGQGLGPSVPTIWELSAANGGCAGSLTPNTGSFTGFLSMNASGALFAAGTNSVVYEFAPGATTATTLSGGGSFIRFDGLGDFWTFAAGTGQLLEFNAQDQLLSPASGYPGGGLTPPANTKYFAEGSSEPQIDGAGAAWLALTPCPTTNGTCSPDIIAGVRNDGTAITPSSGLGLGALPHGATFIDVFGGLAADGSGNLWGLTTFGGLIQYLGLTTPVATPILYNNAGSMP